MLRNKLAPFMREEHRASGIVLKRQGDTATAFHILKTGFVMLCRDDAQGRSQPVAIGGPGLTLGFCAYLQQPNQVTAVMASPARICTVPVAPVIAMEEDGGEVQAVLGGIIDENYRLMARWAQVVGTPSILDRVGASVQLLCRVHGSPRFALPTHTDLAQLLGTRRESVARSLDALEEIGCLRRGSGRQCEVQEEQLQRWLSARH